MNILHDVFTLGNKIKLLFHFENVNEEKDHTNVTNLPKFNKLSDGYRLEAYDISSK